MLEKNSWSNVMKDNNAKILIMRKNYSFTTNEEDYSKYLSFSNPKNPKTVHFKLSECKSKNVTQWIFFDRSIVWLHEENHFICH